MQAIEIGNSEIEYKVIRSDRKTLGLEISKEEGLKVRAPRSVEEERIEEVIKKKADWILKKQERLDKIKSSPKKKEFLSGEKLTYLGRRYRIKLRKKEMKGVQISLYQGKFYIDVDKRIPKKDRRAEVKKELISWYRKKAEKRITERVAKYKSQIGVAPNSVKIKKQKKRWGSCSSLGNLNFNWKIIMAPMSVIDYLVVHELAHLKYPNHSKDFWNLVASVIPDYKKKKEWLRVNGNLLDIV
ncbi:M48 family metallopeptidase [Natroniella sp. ANB-PHB2]|uniref:M48 family metallopeptidase n=1 Tax=Natroniella sp. ANB-PHB2 TaxID=3384444 RepID=UPI0038D49C84